MKKYKVELREIWIQTVIIEANSEEEAEEKVKEGDGEYTDFDYSGTSDIEVKGILDESD